MHILIFWERWEHNPVPIWKPKEVCDTLSRNRCFVTIIIGAQTARWEFIHTNLVWGWLFFWLFIFLSLRHIDLLDCSLSDKFTIMTPFERRRVFTSDLLESSNFFISHEVPNSVRLIVLWLVNKQILFTWWEQNWVNFSLLDGQDWLLLMSVDELYLIGLDDDHERASRTPAEWLVWVEWLLIQRLFLLLWNVPKLFLLALKGLDNDLLSFLETELKIFGV